MAAPRARGITLIEMVVVVAIIGLIVGVSFPAVSAGLDSVRMVSAADSVATFLNGAVNRAERHQQPVELVISPQGRRSSTLYTNEPGFARELEMPDGVTIEAVLPAERGYRPRAAAPDPLPAGSHGARHRDPVGEPPQRAPQDPAGPDDRLSARGKRRDRSEHDRQRGFTLLEMIVATMIMGIAVVGLMSGISSTTRNAARLRDYDRVVQLARLRMNDLLADPRCRATCRRRAVRPGAHRRAGMRLARAGHHVGEVIARAGRRASTCSTASSWRSGGCPAASAGPSRWRATGGARCGRRISRRRCDERAMKRRPTAGVTLIELLIAVTLLSLLSVGLLFALRIGLNAYSKTQTQADGQPAGGRRAAHPGAGTAKA